MHQQNKVIAIVLAAGSGSRFQDDLPKQYHLIHHKPVVQYSLEVFLNHVAVDDIYLVCDLTNLPNEVRHFAKQHNIILVQGSTTRQLSTMAALQEIHTRSIVLVHDAARPCLRKTDIDNLLTDFTEQGTLLATKCTDSIKVVSNNEMHNLSRDTAFLAQTPQCFYSDLLKNAHGYCIARHIIPTDDASAMEALGYTPKIVLGSKRNLKLTTKDDLVILANYLAQEYNLPLEQASTVKQQPSSLRIGHGYDVHKFSPEGKELIVGGIHIPSTLKILAHSDGDVVMHSIIDALLGALALGDIGALYPDNDPKYKNIASSILLQNTLDLVTSRGYTLVNLDCTILLQTPKLRTYIDLMRDKLARIFNCSPMQLSIKATTTELLGYIGRSEGIAATTNLILQKI